MSDEMLPAQRALERAAAAAPPVDPGVAPEAVRAMGGWSPVSVRRASNVWSRLLDPMGEVAVGDMAQARPLSFGRTDSGILFVRGYCCHCSRSMRLPLQGEFSVTIAEGDQIGDVVAEQVELEPGMLSAVAVMCAQRMACTSCIAKIEEEEERKGRRERFGARLGESQIPRGLAGEVTWESLIEKGRTEQETVHRRAAIEACQKWAADRKPDRGILLWGPPGSGKTRLAATTAVARMAHSPIRWVSVAVLMAELEGAWADEDRRKALKVLTSKSVVVLDDLDKIKPGPREKGQIFAALDKREQARQPLIVTTNLKPSELTVTLGETIVSRLLGMCTVYPYPGPDRRLELGEGES